MPWAKMFAMLILRLRRKSFDWNVPSIDFFHSICHWLLFIIIITMCVHIWCAELLCQSDTLISFREKLLDVLTIPEKPENECVRRHNFHIKILAHIFRLFPIFVNANVQHNRTDVCIEGLRIEIRKYINYICYYIWETCNENREVTECVTTFARLSVLYFGSLAFALIAIQRIYNDSRCEEGKHYI